MFGREVLRPDDDLFAERPPVWLWAVVAAAGATAIAFGVLRMMRRRERGPASELDLLEDAAVERLRRDSVTGRAAIDVSALAPGIVELTGVVPTHEVGQRAARLLHALPGVHTVINRLDTSTLEQQLAANRTRRGQGNGTPSGERAQPEAERTEAVERETSAAAQAQE